MENTKPIRQLIEEMSCENECVLCGKPMERDWPLCPGCEAPAKEEGELLPGEFL